MERDRQAIYIKREKGDERRYTIILKYKKYRKYKIDHYYIKNTII